MATTLIAGGRVICPDQKVDAALNVLIENGKIRELTASRPKADEVIDAAGRIVAPGFIDIHVHLREPGRENEETIATGSAAAVAGGFTSIACMPNTEPTLDNEASSEYVRLQAERAGLARIFPVGSITKGRKGQELSEIGQLSRGGAVAFSDDGSPVRNAHIMKRGLEYSKMFDKAIISHPEDLDLTAEGVMNEGLMSTILGLPGMPAAAEEVAIARDIILVDVTGGKLHLAHVSTAGGVELIRIAKKKGVHVTAEATPHHFTLTDECVRTYDPVYKMNPPLRTQADVDAVRQGLKDGTIDVIASDHAPHSSEEKELEFGLAPFGIIGMESMVGVAITELIDKVLGWPELVAKFTCNPAKVLGIPHGTLRPGVDADVTIIDPAMVWTINPAEFKSKSRNCPFAGRQVRGRAVRTIVGGVTKHVIS